ncbi:unnamed protein product [Mycena citricolor]|uniref:Integrase catalytic domain-containing protein n=1 Tax=Mycena citricolor TaxID=2018698 RepID=A0AAD2H659_9AGAR|nr:unnamed protein product [Mycena citricolor]
MVTGMELTSDTGMQQCIACIQGKQHVEPFPKQAQWTFKEVGEMTYTDVWGPSRTPGVHGERFMITFTDAASRYRKVAMLRRKSEVEEEVMSYVEFVLTQTGKQCKAFRFDNRGEYVVGTLWRRLHQKGIRIEETAPYSSQQNGVAERLNRTILEKGRAMIAAHDAPHFLWPEALGYAVYMLNQSPTTALQTNQTPHEAFWGEKPDVSMLQEFGRRCWVLVQGVNEGKLAPKSKAHRFVGISEESRAWRYQVVGTRKVLKSRNVIFETGEGEYIPGRQPPDSPVWLKGEERRREADEGGETGPTSVKAEAGSEHEPIKEGENKEQDAPERAPLVPTLTPPGSPLTTPPDSPQLHQYEPSRAKNDISSRIDERNILPGPRTRHQAAREGADETFRELQNPANQSPNQPDAWRHRVPREDVVNVAVVDPTTPRQAKESPYAREWQEAMEKEHDQLWETGTMELVDLPEGRRALGCKWVYKTKRNEQGKVAGRKARLVVMGNTEIPGTDYNPDQISSPVVRAETNRLLFALAAKYNLEMAMVDVKGAFLNGELKEEIYMRQPEGFDDGTGRVLKLWKTLYSLKQAGRAWNQTLDARFKEMGFHRLLSDRCVYIRRQSEAITIVAVHVDDMSIYATN